MKVSRLAPLFLLLITAGLLVANRLSGATLTWDANTTTAGAQDGSNTWDPSTTADWYNGTSNQTWSAGSTAVFGVGVRAGPSPCQAPCRLAA